MAAQAAHRTEKTIAFWMLIALALVLLALAAWRFDPQPYICLGDECYAINVWGLPP